MTDHESYIKENRKCAITMAIEMLAEYPALLKCQENFYEYNGKCYDMINNQRIIEMYYEFVVKYGILSVWNKRNDVLAAILSSNAVPRVDKMNYHDGFICLNNGIINIETRELLPHAQTYYFDSLVNVDYNASLIDCPAFNGYLSNTFNGDQETIDNVIMLGGYLLDYSCKANKMFIFQGNGGNGKSILIDTFSLFFSTSVIRPQVTSISLSDLSGDKFKKYDLITSRFNQCAEEKKGFLDAEEIKKIVSGELINVAGKFKDTITFRPKTKLIVACNESFKFTDNSDGIMRRLVIINFENQYKDPEEIKRIKYAEEKHIYAWDLDLPGKIDSEKSAILNLFLDGLVLLKQRKYQFIMGVHYNKALTDFRRDSDTTREFLEENYEIDLKGEMPIKTVYEHYRLWYRDNVQDSGSMKFRANEMGRRIKEVFGLDSNGQKKLFNTQTQQYERLSVYPISRKYVIPPEEINPEFNIEEATFQAD